VTNRSQELARAIRESVTPLTVAKQVKPQVETPKKTKIVLVRTVGEALSRAMAKEVGQAFPFLAKDAFEAREDEVQA